MLLFDKVVYRTVIDLKILNQDNNVQNLGQPRTLTNKKEDKSRSRHSKITIPFLKNHRLEKDNYLLQRK